MTNLHDVSIGALDEAAQARDNSPGDDEAAEPSGGPKHPQQLIGRDLQGNLPSGLNAPSHTLVESSALSTVIHTVGFLMSLPLGRLDYLKIQIKECVCPRLDKGHRYCGR